MFETAAPLARHILSAARFLAERGTYGIVWLDDALRPVDRYGPMVDTIPNGAAITDSLDVFHGFDDEIRSLRHSPGRTVAIPNVLVRGTGRPAGERLNYAVFWMADEGGYLLLVARAVSRADLEYPLAAEVRARAIAEAEIAAQAKLVQKANEELAVANRDLEEFAYVISHDLRAPLRGLRYAAGDAQAAVEAGDAQSAADNLRKVLQQARRMSDMLAGLLDYSRAGRKSDVAEVVDTAALIREIAGSFSGAATSKIMIEGSWPSIMTTVEPLDIVLRNLIDNAIKHNDADNGTVVASCEEREDFLQFSVADNGPGIAREWRDAVFEPFRQIADCDNGPEGAGIGLALVKKTVERFGGRIELESNPHERRGATFHVFWPRHAGQGADRTSPLK